MLRSKLPVADLWSGSIGTYIREISAIRGAEVVDVLPCATRQQDNRVNGNFGATVPGSVVSALARVGTSL